MPDLPYDQMARDAHAAMKSAAPSFASDLACHVLALLEEVGRLRAERDAILALFPDRPIGPDEDTAIGVWWIVSMNDGREGWTFSRSNQAAGQPLPTPRAALMEAAGLDRAADAGDGEGRP